jgi:type III pantothenate kinase
MDLLIDIGNTRIKWVTTRGIDMGVMQAAEYKMWRHADVCAHLLSTTEPHERIWISNVGGQSIETLVSQSIIDNTGIKPSVVQSSFSACGVINGYKQPEQLGVDRWLAVIASYGMVRNAICVVSVGTAMTIDAVSPEGQHLGGVIIPGPDMMMNGLMQNTSDIAIRASEGAQETVLFATNTLAAVHQGVRHALTSSVENAMTRLAQSTHSTPTLIITGGATAWLSSLQVAYRTVPDLVLRGLAMVSQETLNIATKENS